MEQNIISSIINNVGGVLMADSRDLAKVCVPALTKKGVRNTHQHGDFLVKAKKVLGEEGIRNFSHTYINEQNGQEYKHLLLPKREACLMAMSYDYELQAQVFDAWMQAEEALRAATTALVEVTVAESLEEAQDIAVKAISEVHKLMLVKKPRKRVRSVLSDFTNISEGASSFITEMHNNPKATFEDRKRTLLSLAAAVNESYDKLHARETTKATEHEQALNLIADELLRLERIDKNTKVKRAVSNK